jgi:hypothetical protein
LLRAIDRIRCGVVTPAAERFTPIARFFAIYKFETICAAILALMAVNLISVTVRKSITTDEVVLIPSAYYHLVADEVHLIGQHPPLCKLLAGLPLLFIQPNEWAPAKVDPAASPDQNEWNYTVHFWQDNRALFEVISFWARMPMVALTLALGFLVFLFARDLLGPRAAVLAVTLFAVEPTILAHGRIVQTDIPAAFGLLLSVFALYRYLREPNWKKACGIGAAVAIAMLAKYSMLVIGPAFLVVLLVLFWRERKRRADLALHTLIVTGVLLLVINAAYFFHNRPLTEGDLKWIATVFPEAPSVITASVRALRLVLPTDFVMGVYWQLHHSRVGHPAGLLGMYSNHGWWFYFPVAFAFKATIPFLALSVTSVGWALYRVISRREFRWLVLLIPLGLYTALLMRSPIDIGVRYYLPAYIFLIILSACLLESLFRNRSARMAMARGVVAIVALLWMGFEAFHAYPNYLPYLNQLAVGRPHWWYLSDSNVEWGDDARDLAIYLRAHGQTQVRGLLLGCFATLDFYGVNYVDALAKTTEKPPRYTALGASFLNGSTVPPYEIDGKRVPDEVRVNTFDSFRHLKPETVIGDSIYLYRTGD